MTTALHLLSEELGLSPREERLVRVLLASTPLAIRGEATMAKVKELAAEIEADVFGEQQRLGAAEETTRQLLFKPRVAKGVVVECQASFSVLHAVEWTHGATFVEYAFSRAFLDVLVAIANNRRLGYLY